MNRIIAATNLPTSVRLGYDGGTQAKELACKF